MTPFSSMLPAEMQVRTVEPEAPSTSGQPAERHVALAAVCMAVAGALIAAVLLG